MKDPGGTLIQLLIAPKNYNVRVALSVGADQRMDTANQVPLKFHWNFMYIDRRVGDFIVKIVMVVCVGDHAFVLIGMDTVHLL